MTYKELIEKVRKVDSTAAMYMEGDARKLGSFSIDNKNDNLDDVFEWAETPQGTNYWWKIEDAILGVSTYVGG